MNEQIQEYRKASAEALGVDWKEDQMSGLPIHLRSPKWHPDTDANQMLMVWDWLRKEEGRGIDCSATSKIIFVTIWKWFHKNGGDKYMGEGKDIKLATMKAFMEWQRKEEG